VKVDLVCVIENISRGMVMVETLGMQKEFKLKEVAGLNI
jgi:hypothetical protein